MVGRRRGPLGGWFCRASDSPTLLPPAPDPAERAPPLRLAPLSPPLAPPCCLRLSPPIPACVLVCVRAPPIAGGTFALYALLCRKIGIRPHGALYHGEGKMHRNLSTLTVGRRISQGGFGSGAGLGAGTGRPWWKRFAASGSAVRRFVRGNRALQVALWLMTIAATGMVLGDGVLTPAISGASCVCVRAGGSAGVCVSSCVSVSRVCTRGTPATGLE